MDRFTWSLARGCELIANKVVGNPQGFRVEEEMSALDNRAEFVGDNKDKAYEKALRMLAKLRPEYKKYLPKEKMAIALESKLLRKRMRLAVWVGTGNFIPFRELNVAKILSLLKSKGYAYRRNELRWYRGDLCVGEDLFTALEHLESAETVDRSRLTVNFQDNPPK